MDYSKVKPLIQVMQDRLDNMVRQIDTIKEQFELVITQQNGVILRSSSMEEKENLEFLESTINAQLLYLMSIVHERETDDPQWEQVDQLNELHNEIINQLKAMEE